MVNHHRRKINVVLAAMLLIAAVDRLAFSRGDVGGVSYAGGDTTRYRSFTPDSLVERREVRRESAGTSFCATFTNTTGALISGIQVKFKYSVTLTGFAPFPDAYSSEEGRVWNVYGQKMADGDSFSICGVAYGKDSSPINEWAFTGNNPSPPQPGFAPSNQHTILPMPNTANLRREVYQFGGFSPGTSESDSAGGMVIGKSFMRFTYGRWRVNPDSARKYGWVRLRKSTDILRSLHPLRNNIGHTGAPRGFVYFNNGRPFIRQVYNLPPVKMDNRLFAELVALKLNIAASTLGMTPVGFGELEYDDNGHPLDELMIRQISDRADSMMTYSAGRDSTVYKMLDSVVHKINGAFSGPIDTISFGSALRFKGTRPLSEVPFLRRGLPPTVIQPVFHPEFDDDESDEDEFLPQTVDMAQNYPNPFNPTTTIQFELSDNALLTITVYDLLGRLVATLAQNELFTYGTNEIAFNASGLSSGVYFYRIAAADMLNAEQTSQQVYKMVLLK